MVRFPHVFAPIALRSCKLKNRIVFGAHTVDMSYEGLPGDRHFGYYRERARGGAAMIVVEPAPAHRTARLIRGNFLHENDAVIPYFRRITEECHRHDVVTIHQIYHVGAHGDQDNSWEPYWSPSGMPSLADPWGSHTMTGPEIGELIDAFVQAARRDKEAGFDGVDLFAGYGALLDQFWSPISNQRTDKWGGSLENRVRFTVEICRRIRQLAGDDFIVGMTVSGAEPVPGGLSIEDKTEIARYLDERGLVDYFSVSTGSYLNQVDKTTPSFQFPFLLGAEDAAHYKQAVKHALVTAEARIKTPANAEKVLSEGKADLVSIVRGQIADPHLANKAKEGRPEDIRPCISCNQLCIGRRMRDYWISCLVNPSVAREHDWGEIAPAKSRRRILVVGAGPAGLEAARTAAERGHQVAVLEKEGELGGQFRLAAGQPDRGEISQLLGWYELQLEKLGVAVSRRTEATVAAIKSFGADAIVIATGSSASRRGFQRALPHLPGLPGAEQDSVCTVHDVLAGRVVPGHRVLLLDDIYGWWPASGTALHLAQQRHMVTVVTGSEKPAAALDNSRTGETTRARFMQYGVEVLTSTALRRWSGGKAELVHLHTQEEEGREFDTLVLATTNVPNDMLMLELAESELEVHGIGDAVAARTAAMAFYEGRRLGRRL